MSSQLSTPPSIRDGASMVKIPNSTTDTTIPHSKQHTFTSPPASSETTESLPYTIKLPLGASEQDYRVVADELVQKGAEILSLYACDFFGTLGVAVSRGLLEELKSGKLECCRQIVELFPARIRYGDDAEEGKKNVVDEAGTESLFD